MVDMDEKTLYGIASNDEHGEVRKYATERIKDESLKQQATERGKAIEFDINRIVRLINSDGQHDKETATIVIFEMIDSDDFTSEGRNRVIAALLDAMKRPVTNRFDYSLTDVNTPDYKHKVNLNGNAYIGQLLSVFYNDSETAPDDKEKIKALGETLLVSYHDYEGRRSPIYFDCEKGTRFYGSV